MTDQERNNAPCHAPTGPGWYMRRNGTAAKLKPREPEDDYSQEDLAGDLYTSDGSFYEDGPKSPYDIIAPVSLEPTDEQIVARFNELVSAGKVEYYSGDIWGQVHGMQIFRLRPETTPISLKVTLPPGCEDELRKAVEALGGEVG